MKPWLRWMSSAHSGLWYERRNCQPEYPMPDRKQIEKSISALEAQRTILGNEVVDPAINALREKLAAYKVERPHAQQRKQITVMFADITGFTSLAETMDAEVVNDLINSLWSRLDKLITDFGGRIDKHIGDAIMALWGSETSREDDAECAIRAALEIQKELGGFKTDVKLPLTTATTIALQIKIGIHSGPVLLGEVGTVGEYTAIGDTVNTANRLQNITPAGSVLISHDTYRLVRGIFDVIPQDPIQVKGKSEPLNTYIVQRAKQRTFRMPTRGVEGIETRMIGRTAEFNLLQHTFFRTIEQHHTCLVMLSGEAGMGKSRLLYEFSDWLDLQPEEVVLFKGRASPTTINSPFSLLRDMFAFRFNILDSDDALTVLEKFRFGTAGILEAERADLAGHLIGFDFSSSLAVRNLLGSPSFSQLASAYLISYLRHITKEDITAIFLEDIHWADDSSLEFIKRIAKEIPQARLLIICLARPSFFESHPAWFQDLTGCIQIELKPLTKEESQDLASEILQKVDKVPDSLQELIITGAEGNPYYQEELIKMLIDDGVIVIGEPNWRIVIEQLKLIRIPATLTGILQARLDSLPSDEKELLQRAAVVGRIFWDAATEFLKLGWQKVVSSRKRGDRSDTQELLTHLRERELIFRQDRSAFAGTVEYLFKHAILHEVVYESVLLKLRRVYHARAANWLETNAGERIGEFLVLIAQHYELAGVPSTAAAYLHQAGNELINISAFRDAINVLERALGMMPEDDLSARAALMAKLGHCYERIGKYIQAVQYLEAGLPIARESGDRRTEVAVLNELGRVAWDQGEYENARGSLEPALKIAGSQDDQKGMALCLWSLGVVARYQGKNDESIQYLTQSLEIYQQLNDQQGVANTLNVLGMVAFGQQNYPEADLYYSKALAIFRAIGERRGVFACLNNLGVSARKQGNYEKALQHFEEILPIGREINLRHGLAACLTGLGLLHLSQGENDKAWEAFLQALEESRAVGATSFTLHTLVGVAGLRVKAGQFEQAAEVLGMILNHPSATLDAKQDADPILKHIEQCLSSEQLLTALSRGRSLDIETFAQQILSEKADGPADIIG
jgi:class 3 adenylate cyclase/predicted ATPase